MVGLINSINMGECSISRDLKGSTCSGPAFVCAILHLNMEIDLLEQVNSFFILAAVTFILRIQLKYVRFLCSFCFPFVNIFLVLHICVGIRFVVLVDTGILLNE